MWEYEALFDVTDLDGLTPLERAARMESGDRWKEEDTRAGKGKMCYRTRTIKAGPRLEAEIFPIFGKGETETARAAKKNMTPEKIQQHNDERQRRKLVRLLDANFSSGDLHITLTFAGRAPGWDRAKKDVENFRKRLAREREKRGLPPLKYIYALEDGEEGRDKRIHCHFVTTGDMSREDLERIWRNGKRDCPGFANCDTLQPDKEGLDKLGRYIYNQNPGKPREKGKRKYSCSKNLKKPKTRTSDTKVTKAKVKRLSDVFSTDPTESRRIMEKLYPGYEFVKGTAYRSDIINGVYIRVLMRKREERS